MCSVGTQLRTNPFASKGMIKHTCLIHLYHTKPRWSNPILPKPAKVTDGIVKRVDGGKSPFQKNKIPPNGKTCHGCEKKRRTTSRAHLLLSAATPKIPQSHLCRYYCLVQCRPLRPFSSGSEVGDAAVKSH